MTRCFTCNKNLDGPPTDFIQGYFGDNGPVELPVYSLDCLDDCDWATKRNE